MKRDGVPEDIMYCHRCRCERRWKRVRGGKAVRCEVCGDRFPCRNKDCGHSDCDAVRQAQSTPTTTQESQP